MALNTALKTTLTSIVSKIKSMFVQTVNNTNSEPAVQIAENGQVMPLCLTFDVFKTGGSPEKYIPDEITITIPEGYCASFMPISSMPSSGFFVYDCTNSYNAKSSPNDCGYYYNGEFYASPTHEETSKISPVNNGLYYDFDSQKIYLYSNNAYTEDASPIRSWLLDLDTRSGSSIKIYTKITANLYFYNTSNGGDVPPRSYVYEQNETESTDFSFNNHGGPYHYNSSVYSKFGNMVESLTISMQMKNYNGIEYDVDKIFAKNVSGKLLFVANLLLVPISDITYKNA